MLDSSHLKFVKHWKDERLASAVYRPVLNAWPAAQEKLKSQCPSRFLGKKSPLVAATSFRQKFSKGVCPSRFPGESHYILSLFSENMCLDHRESMSGSVTAAYKQRQQRKKKTLAIAGVCLDL